MGLVKGFTDIIAPQNLATNGSFRINQRGNFQNVSAYENMTDAARVKAGDFIVDGWYVGPTTVDSLFALHSHTHYASISLQGYGKKGQEIVLYSKDKQQLSQAKGWPVLTASVQAYLTPTSIPMFVDAIPRRLTDYHDVAVYNRVFLKRGETKKAVRVHEQTHYCSFDYGAQITIGLLADGYFHIVLSGFCEMSGAFVNPPDIVDIHYADDLLRCKRYYQVGHTTVFGANRESATHYIVGAAPAFPVEMAGTPTISATLESVFEAGSDTNVGANYTFATGYSSPKSFMAQAYKLIGGNKPEYFEFSWTATV